MNYLIVCKSDNKLFLLMVKSEDKKYAIAAYSSREQVMDNFKGYTEAWTRDMTWNASACIGMMNMQPVAIEAPDEKDIEKYIIEPRLFHITGGAMLRGYHGIPVKEEILERKQFDIWRATMQAAGILEVDK